MFGRKEILISLNQEYCFDTLGYISDNRLFMVIIPQKKLQVFWIMLYWTHTSPPQMYAKKQVLKS